jgi:anti-sigma B factor antagonist
LLLVISLSKIKAAHFFLDNESSLFYTTQNPKSTDVHLNIKEDKMKIKKQMVGDVAVLSLSMTLFSGAPDSQEFKDQIYQLLDEGVTKFVIDMKGVKRMDSTGLGVLISALTSVRKRGGEFKLSEVNDIMESILIMTKLDSIFETHKTTEAAVQSFAKK